MTAPSRRYEWQALLDVIGCDDQTAKSRLGLDHRQVARYRAEGLTERRADELATTAGWPSHVVWPELLEDAITDVSKECASTDCTTLFVPAINQKYCSGTCKQREKMRRYRATPGGAANNRFHRRKWYAECRDYDVASSRRRREARREAA